MDRFKVLAARGREARALKRLHHATGVQAEAVEATVNDALARNGSSAGPSMSICVECVGSGSRGWAGWRRAQWPPLRLDWAHCDVRCPPPSESGWLLDVELSIAIATDAQPQTDAHCDA
eukprot:2581032-Alexandrium_andersonii.AAC.1